MVLYYVPVYFNTPLRTYAISLLVSVEVGGMPDGSIIILHQRVISLGVGAIEVSLRQTIGLILRPGIRSAPGERVPSRDGTGKQNLQLGKVGQHPCLEQ